MPVSAPPLQPEQIAYVESAATILVGTCSAERSPEGVRGVGLRVLPGATRIEVLLPVAMADRTLANLAENPQLAVTTARLPTFSTIAMKGTLASVRDGGPADHALALAFPAMHAAEFAWAGDAITRIARIGVWPCKVLELAIENIYSEAPAPLEVATGQHGRGG